MSHGVACRVVNDRWMSAGEQLGTAREHEPGDEEDDTNDQQVSMVMSTTVTQMTTVLSEPSFEEEERAGTPNTGQTTPCVLRPPALVQNVGGVLFRSYVVRCWEEGGGSPHCFSGLFT